jgi:PST family polysaccharide transporter
MNIFIVIVDYGFNMSGTKEISSNHENENIVNGIINSILTIKIFIVIIAFLFLLLLVYFVPSYKKENLLYILSFALPLGRAFFPVWYFQGMQKMQFLIFFSLISKGLAALFIILFITKPENYILINLIIGSTDFIGSLIMLFIVFYLFKYKFSLPTKNEIVFQVKNGFYLFLASFFAMVISNSYLIILGFFGTGKQVGIYSVSDKIVFFIKQLPSIAFQAIYPHACRVWENSKKLFFSLLNKLYLSYFVILLIIF